MQKSIETDALGRAYAISFKNHAVQQCYVWILTDPRDMEARLAELKKLRYIEILSSGPATVK